MNRHIQISQIISIIALTVVLACSSIKEQSETIDLRPESNKKMAAYLAKIAQEAEPEYNYTLNTQRAAKHLKLHRMLGGPDDDEYLVKYARELVDAGQNEKAIKIIEKRIRELGFGELDKINQLQYPYFIILGMAYTQLAEEENCVMGHSTGSCIIPIQGNGLHQKTYASERAIEIYTKILNGIPEDLSAKWLLNLGYMTLGKYPESVPDKYLIPGLETPANISFPRFSDIAGTLGLDVLGLAGGVSTEDFDNDGDIDLMLSSYGLKDQLRYFEQNETGFVERTDQAGLNGIVSGLNMIHADYNNDGFTDVLVLRGAWFKSHGRHPNSLLQNKGNGRFEDVTEQAGLLSFYPTQTAAWADFNLDGHLDLFIGNESSENNIYPCKLYQNVGNGTFKEVSKTVGISAIGMFKGCAWGDINNDGLPDLYLSDYAGANRLYLNNGGSENGQWHFEEIGEKAGVEQPIFSFPTWFFDYNNDGLEDIFVSGFDQKRMPFAAFDEALELLGRNSPAEKPRLYRNNGDLTFTDVTKFAGLDRVVYTMGSNFGDLDNDGWLDFYLGTGTPDLSAIVPNRMYLNKEGLLFEDITMKGGFGHIQKGHGVSFVDFDADGDQDVYAVMGGAVSGDTFHNVLFENPGFGNNWITLQLEGSQANRSAIGAKIKISVEEEPGKERQIYRVVNTGGSFGSSSLQQEIGLGKATIIKSITVTWPETSGSQTNWSNVKINQKIRIRQENERYEIVN